MSKEFREKDKMKCLLWCNRHCCLCGKSCGIDIELAHLPGKEDSDDIDDGIPVCSECHIKIGAYSSEHLKGTKYKPEELKVLREQVYEEYTRHLVPPIHFELTQDLSGGGKRSLPDIGFKIIHLSNSLPVKALVATQINLKDKCLKKLSDGGGHYGGKAFWRLNPRFGYVGHFSLPEEAVKSNEPLEITVHVTIVDQYERYHKLLPVSWAYDRKKNLWWSNP